jgi:hypothetical protein
MFRSKSLLDDRGSLATVARHALWRCLSAGTACIASLLALAASTPLAWADDAAARLAQAVHDRPAGRDATTVSRMELVERGRAPRVRQFVAYRQDRAAAGSANLIRFVQPEDIEGTGLLGITKADGSTDQWLFLPELDRTRRIAGDRKGGRFVGSDLYFEDLQERLPDKDRHRLLGKEAVGDTDCDVLESVPLDPSSSVYLRRVSWVDPQTFMVLRVDYFEKDPARPSKRWVAVGRRKVQNIWTVMQSVMADLQSGHETRIQVQKVIYDRKLPDKLFSTRALADEQIEAEFRP